MRVSYKTKLYMSFISVQLVQCLWKYSDFITVLNCYINVFNVRSNKYKNN